MALLPLEDAVKRISAKTPIGSALRSKDWEGVPLALRERAQFSAGVESVRVLQGIQDRLLGEVSLAREKLDGGKEAMFDRSSFIDSIRGLARQEGLEPEKGKGSITDITSIPRLGMIYDMQNQMATGFARWKMDQNEGALALYPAWRLVRESQRKEPRDWAARWAEAYDQVGGEGAKERPWVALKTSPIWAALSRFGTPWAPFDYNSGMGVEEVDYEEAVSLGLLKDGEVPEASGEEDFNAQLRASTEGLSPEFKGQLKEWFGDQVKVEDGEVWWQGQERPEKVEPVPVQDQVKIPPKPVVQEPVIDTRLADLEKQMVGGGFSSEVAKEALKIPRQVADLAKTVVVRTGQTETGYYDPRVKTVVMGKDPKSWNGRAELFNHEFGHHIHYETRAITSVDLHPKVAEAIDKTVKRLRKENKANGGKYSPLELTDHVRQMYDVESFDKGSLDEKSRIARVCDTMGGLTKGAMGWGHSKKYYKTGNNGAMEAFANAYSALVDGDKVFVKMFPELMETVKGLIESRAP